MDLSVETAQRPRICEIGEIFENPSDAFGPLGRPIPQYPNAFGDLPLEHLLGKRGGLSFGDSNSSAEAGSTPRRLQICITLPVIVVNSPLHILLTWLG